MSNNYLVKPVQKALGVLKHLAEAAQPLTLSQISYRVGLPKTSVFRYLHTLRDAGLVTYDQSSDRYHVSLYLWSMGQLADARFRIRDIALPVLRMLRDRHNETINLAVIEEHEIVYLEMVESRHALMMNARPGSRDPVYSTALGRAMLAHLPQEQWAQHLPPQLEARTLQTVTSLAALRQELEQTRQRGYSLDRGENEDGARCIGAPILDAHARVVAAISLSAPATRLTRAQEPVVIRSIVDAAAAISRQIGYNQR